MESLTNKVSPQAAFIPIGIALMVVGLNNNKGLIGAGVVFLIIGIAGVVRHKRSRTTSPETGDEDKPTVG